MSECPNPYESPQTEAAAAPEIGRKLGYAFLGRFSIGIVIMAGLNLARLVLTWRAFGADGYEQIGFPLVFFERGGVAYTEKLYLHFLFADLAIAVGVAYLAARGCLRAAFRRMRTWGLDDAK